MIGASPAAGGALLAIGVAIFIAEARSISSTLNAIFRVALLRYATSDEVVAGFERDQMEHAFRPRRGRF